jgi:Bacteriophage lambda head decoration protein D
MSETAKFSSDAYVPDELIANEPALLLSEKVTLLSGQNLTRGALLGKITASGKYVLSLSASSDGSQTPSRVLVDDVDASAGDKEALAYRRGDFLDKGMTFGTGHTAASVKDGLADIGIFIITAQGGV